MRTEKLATLLLSITILFVNPALASSSEALVPVHKRNSWPVDVASDLSQYSIYVELKKPQLSRSLRQAANRLKAARLLYPDYPNLSTGEKNKRYQNCLPTIADLKLLKQAAASYPYRSQDKAIYASIYAMRLIGRDSERYWKVAPEGPISEMREIINDALLTLNTNVSKKHPSRIPLILAKAYFYLHTGRQEKALRMTRLAILMAREHYGKGSRQGLSAIKYSSLIFDCTDRKDEFLKKLKNAMDEEKIAPAKLNSKDDFYY